MVSCSNCGLENDDSFAYCVRCGSNLNETDEKPVAVAQTPPQIKECPQCGARVPTMFRFCGTCGHPFSSQTADIIPPKPTSYTVDEVKRVDRVPPPVPTAPPPIDKKVPKTARLIVINKDGTEGDVIPISGSSLTLGRESFFSALSEDPCLSPEHITFRETSRGYEISDADSLNGVFISVGPDPVPLEHGDQLRFGRQLIEFRVVENENELAKDAQGTRLAGSVDYPYWGLVSVISHPDVDCQVFPIVKDFCIIGREKGDITMPNDYYVSGTHLEIRRTPAGAFSVRDLNSSNGTYIRIKKPVMLTSEEKIMMGQQLFLLRY